MSSVLGRNHAAAARSGVGNLFYLFVFEATILYFHVSFTCYFKDAVSRPQSHVLHGIMFWKWPDVWFKRGKDSDYFESMYLCSRKYSHPILREIRVFIFVMSLILWISRNFEKLAWCCSAEGDGIKKRTSIHNTVS